MLFRSHSYHEHYRAVQEEPAFPLRCSDFLFFASVTGSPQRILSLHTHLILYVTKQFPLIYEVFFPLTIILYYGCRIILFSHFFFLIFRLPSFQPIGKMGTFTIFKHTMNYLETNLSPFLKYSHKRLDARIR